MWQPELKESEILRVTDSIAVEKRTLISYLGAVGSAMGVSLTVRHISKTLQSRAMLLLAPVCGVVAAAVTNLCLTRQRELTEGIEVETADGKIIGRSQTAARKAIFETAISRAVLPLPALGVTPFVFQSLENAQWYKSLATRIGRAGPLGVKYIALMVIRLEPELKKKIKNDTGHVWYNKGL
ncbi:hypothetical protein AAMO2058_000094700 [Amorphochlora amoebiformis]